MQVIGLPTVLFLAFLGWRLLPSVRKLQRSQSHIMTTYYGFLWGVSLLNLMRCIALVAEDLQPSGDKYLPPLLLNDLWLLTRFGAHIPSHNYCPVLLKLPLRAALRANVTVLFCRVGLHWPMWEGVLKALNFYTCFPLGLVMLEVSVVVFLLQGYLTSGREVGCFHKQLAHVLKCISTVLQRIARVHD